MNLETFCENIRRQTGTMPDVDGASVKVSGVKVANIVNGECIPVPMKELVKAGEPLLASLVWAVTRA
jgi:hypothetical protein